MGTPLTLTLSPLRGARGLRFAGARGLRSTRKKTPSPRPRRGEGWGEGPCYASDASTPAAPTGAAAFARRGRRNQANSVAGRRSSRYV